MKFPRRQFLHLAGGADALPAVAHSAPNWLRLSERLGQPFLIDNRPKGIRLHTPTGCPTVRR
jgi:hypothetical protein